MSENIYDIQEVKELLDNEIEHGDIDEITLGLTSELEAPEKEIRQAIFDIKSKILTSSNTFFSDSHIPGDCPVNLVNKKGDVSIAVDYGDDFEEEVEKIRNEALDRYGDLNPKISDCHLNYRIIPSKQGEYGEIIDIVNDKVSNGIVNEIDINISSKILPEGNLKGVREVYRKLNRKYQGEEHFHDNHFVIFDGPHYRSEDGELRFSVQDGAGRSLRKRASETISEYFQTMSPKIEESEISLLVTPERYGR